MYPSVPFSFLHILSLSPAVDGVLNGSCMNSDMICLIRFCWALHNVQLKVEADTELRKKHAWNSLTSEWESAATLWQERMDKYRHIVSKSVDDMTPEEFVQVRDVLLWDVVDLLAYHQRADRLADCGNKTIRDDRNDSY